MTEPKPITAYMTGADERKQPQAWHCPGCGAFIGYTYSHPRRLMIVTDNMHFMIRGDCTITHTACGTSFDWIWRREEHGMLDELETTQEVISDE